MPETKTKTDSRSVKKPMQNATPSGRESREKAIIRDLALQIESRGREKFIIKAGNVKKRIMDAMLACWPRSSDETLAKLAIAIMSGSEPDDMAVFAEIRELNAAIIPGERPMAKCPFDGEESEDGMLR